jgi:hypothetical protein
MYYRDYKKLDFFYHIPNMNNLKTNEELVLLVNKLKIDDVDDTAIIQVIKIKKQKKLYKLKAKKSPKEKILDAVRKICPNMAKALSTGSKTGPTKAIEYLQTINDSTAKFPGKLRIFVIAEHVILNFFVTNPFTAKPSPDRVLDSLRHIWPVSSPPTSFSRTWSIFQYDEEEIISELDYFRDLYDLAKHCQENKKANGAIDKKDFDAKQEEPQQEEPQQGKKQNKNKQRKKRRQHRYHQRQQEDVQRLWHSC